LEIASFLCEGDSKASLESEEYPLIR